MAVLEVYVVTSVGCSRNIVQFMAGVRVLGEQGKVIGSVVGTPLFYCLLTQVKGFQGGGQQS